MDQHQPEHSTAAADPRLDSASGASSRSPGMSDTGSFPLPPPRATVTSSPAPAPPAPDHAPPTPAQDGYGVPHPQAGDSSPVSPHDPTHPLRSPLPPPAPYPEAATAEYTAQGSRLPPPGEAPPVRGSTARRTHRRRARRPGPSAKVAVPVLFLALACYAVGFWALTHV